MYFVYSGDMIKKYLRLERRMKPVLSLLYLLVFLLFNSSGIYAVQDNRKVLYIASYHTEKDEWSQGIREGIEEVLSAADKIELRIFNMDTRLAQTEEEKIAAALKAKSVIEQFNPDVVIISDDNAAKYLLQPYYKDSAIPFVFCGINWEAASYGLPYSNTTGMIEVQLIKETVNTLKPYAKGVKTGCLRGDTLTNRKEQKYFDQQLGQPMDVRYVTNYEQWQKEFLQLQHDVDILILGSLRALDTQNATLDQIANFTFANTTIPTASYDEFMKQTSLLTLSTVPQEQGRWAATQALRILDGTPPATIQPVQNREAKRFLHMKLAGKLNIKFPYDLVESSHLVSYKLPKVLYIGSYHEGYFWSDNIEKGLKKGLGLKQTAGSESTEPPVVLDIFRMNTKLRSDEESKKNAALEALQRIEQFQPDLIVISDDNAAKYLVQPYLLETTIPIVFCGINYDASQYHLPTANSTGMLEIDPIAETVEFLSQYAKGKRIGYLGSDDISNKKTIQYNEKILGAPFTEGYLVSSYEEWKLAYQKLQTRVDMLIILNPIGIRGWSPEEADDFILHNTKIPSGGISAGEMRYSLLGHVKIPEEQGWWSGKTALKILEGTSPAAIPIVTNKQTRLFLNPTLANAIGIHFPVQLLEEATLVQQHHQ